MNNIVNYIVQMAHNAYGLEWGPILKCSLIMTCPVIMIFIQYLPGGWNTSAKVKYSVIEMFTNLSTKFKRNKPVRTEEILK